RFINDKDQVGALRGEIGNDLDAALADDLGLVTFIPDDIDWEDEVITGTLLTRDGAIVHERLTEGGK
ncbi:MAG: hypothetical protein JKY59_00995, partial [Emcibacter sp.]|nr:hypothetical protein [Emcibacter sp.]